MRKIFLILFFFFSFLITIFDNPQSIFSSSHVTPGTNSCSSCPTLSGTINNQDLKDYVGDVIKSDTIPGVDSFGTYLCPDGTRDPLGICVENNIVDAYCRYKYQQSSTYKYLIAVPKRQNACSGTTPVCSEASGCIASGVTDPATCSIKGKAIECSRPSDCKNGIEAACSNYWCTYGEGKEKIPDSMLEIGEKGFCKRFDSEPACPKDETCTGFRSDENACHTCPDDYQYSSSRSTCIKYFPGAGVVETSPKKSAVCGEDQNCVQGEGCQKRFDDFVPGDARCDESGGNKKCNKINVGGITDIKTTVGGFVTSLLTILLSLSGGIAVILIIISGYRLMVSRGNPEQVQNAREQLTAAIVGLLFVIFSLVILTVIGINILGIFP